MVNIREPAKGITFFLFVTIMFYFFWENIFSNLLEYVGSDIFNTGDGTSIAILKTFAWVSYVVLYLAVGAVYLIHTIIQGSSGNVQTKPLELLKAIGTWVVLMPILSFLFGVINYLKNTLDNVVTTDALMDSASITMADTFTWMLAIIVFACLVFVPFIYVLKGYGLDLFGYNKEEPAG